MTPSERTGTIGIGLAVLLVGGLATLLFGTDPQGAGDQKDPAGSGRRKDDSFEIHVVHEGEQCKPPCRQDEHWSVRLRGRTAGLKELRATLRAEANRARLEPSDTTRSERLVLILGSDPAPWGMIQRAMNECAKVGIYKIDWGMTERPRVQVWLPVARMERDRAILEEIRVFMKWDLDGRATMRKVSNRGMVDSDEELMNIITQMSRDYAKAGKTDVPVLIDATPDVPWKAVFHVMDLCRKEKLLRIEFAAPFN
jgi:hypothetical protein